MNKPVRGRALVARRDHRQERSGARPAEADAPLDRILAGVRALLTRQSRVELVDDGIDLCFAGGVDVRCRTCGVAWSVSRADFRTLAGWSCPRGCQPASRSVGTTAAAASQH
jgi:hypothetical protein